MVMVLLTVIFSHGATNHILSLSFSPSVRVELFLKKMGSSTSSSDSTIWLPFQERTMYFCTCYAHVPAAVVSSKADN